MEDVELELSDSELDLLIKGAASGCSPESQTLLELGGKQDDQIYALGKCILNEFIINLTKEALEKVSVE